MNMLDWMLGLARRAKSGGLAVVALSVLLLTAPGAIAQTDGAQPVDGVSNAVLAERINSLWDAIGSVRREMDGLRAEMAAEFDSLKTSNYILLGVTGLIATLLALLFSFATFSHGNLQKRMARMEEQITEQNRQITEQNRQIAEQNRQIAEQNRRMDERMSRIEGQIARLLPPDEQPAARRVAG